MNKLVIKKGEVRDFFLLVSISLALYLTGRFLVNGICEAIFIMIMSLGILLGIASHFQLRFGYFSDTDAMRALIQKIGSLESANERLVRCRVVGFALAFLSQALLLVFMWSASYRPF